MVRSGLMCKGYFLAMAWRMLRPRRLPKKSGVRKFVYVSVASEVANCFPAWLPSFFGGYFDGKAQAEEAITDAVGEGNACFVKPTFIYGGESFGLFPPRVNGAYGAAVEELLMLQPFQAAANVLPGLIKVALRPPVSVDAVAGACAAFVVGDTDATTIDGTVAINAAARQPDATGLTDLAAKVKDMVSGLSKAAST